MTGLRIVPRRCTRLHMKVVESCFRHLLMAWDLDDKHRPTRLRVEVGMYRRQAFVRELVKP